MTQGFGDDDNSWEPANNLADCQRLMQACDAAIAEKAGPKKTKKIKPVVAVEDEFEVEAVINSRRGSGSVIQYLVKWKVLVAACCDHQHAHGTATH